MRIFKRHIEHPYLDALALIFVIVLVAGSVFGYTRFQAVEQAKRDLALNKATERKALEEFESLLAMRAEFMTVIAVTDAAQNAAKAKVADGIAQKNAWDAQAAAIESDYQASVAAVRAHNDAETAKYRADPRYSRDIWSAPSLPGQPAPINIDFAAEIAGLEKARTELAGFKKTFTAARGGYTTSELKAMYADLLKSVEDTLSMVDRNIEILGSLAVSGKEGVIVNDARADLLKYDSENEGLEAFASKALRFIDAHDLDAGDYDLKN